LKRKSGVEVEKIRHRTLLRSVAFRF